MGAGPPVTATLWVSHDVGIDMTAYERLIEGMAVQPGSEWMRRPLEIDGYPVRQEIQVGPVTSWQELVSIAEEPAPAGV